MNLRSWRTGSILIVAIVGVPALITGGALVGVRYVDNHRFDLCLRALPSQNLKDPGVAFILDDLKGTGRYESTSWNINKPYRPDAYNLLVPSGDVTKWPAVCEVPREVPDCMASPKSHYVICNPEMGQEFQSRLLHSGAASIETDAAIRFVLLTFLGHEFGHIEKGTSAKVQHLVPGSHEGALSCVQHPTDAPSEEEEADAFGTDVACRAIARRLGSEQVPSDVSEPLKLVSSLQDQLDDSYFLRDDACVGDKSYPSIGRRKHTFSVAYLKCLYPSQWNPAEILAESDAKTFDRLESWLQSRQTSGQIASGSYGKDSLYAHTVTALSEKGSYLTFDSTGTASNLWLVRTGRDGVIYPDSLQRWQSVGRLLSSQPLDHGRSLWLSIAHTSQSETGELVHLNVSCAEDEPSCTVSDPLRAIPISDGFQAVGSDDGSVAMISKDSVTRPDPSTADRSPASIPHRLALESADDAVVALNKDETVVLARKNDAGHEASIIHDGRAARSLLMLIPTKDKETLEAAAIVDNRILLSSQVEPVVGDSSLYLWDCPLEIVDHSTATPEPDCIRYQAPGEIAHSLSLATRDLSSLFDLSIRNTDGCGGLVAIQHRGWLWVIDRKNGMQDLLATDGIVSCNRQDNLITTYRARRLDVLKLSLRPVTSDHQSVFSLEENR
jgi:hypothetical protein